MKKLIKIFLAVLIFVTVACDDTNKVDYVPPVTITFENVDESNIIVVEKGVTSYTANITIKSSTKIRALSLYKADVKSGAKGDKIGMDTIFTPSLDSYTFSYQFDSLYTNKAILVEVQDDNIMSFSKKLLVKITKDVFESGVVTIESSEAFFGPYFGSWLEGRSYISLEAPKYVNEIDFSFGNLALNGTDTVAALVSPNRREELGLPFIPNLKSCTFELTNMTRGAFDSIPATDGSAIRTLATPTKTLIQAVASNIYAYENETDKGLIYIAVVQNKKGPLQQQNGSWIENQSFHQLKIITKTVAKK